MPMNEMILQAEPPDITTSQGSDGSSSFSNNSNLDANRSNLTSSAATLAPRAKTLDVLRRPDQDLGPSSRPKLVSDPTTALSSTEVQGRLADKIERNHHDSTSSDKPTATLHGTDLNRIAEFVSPSSHSKSSTASESAINNSVSAGFPSRPSFKEIQLSTERQTRFSQGFWRSLQRLNIDSDFEDQEIEQENFSCGLKGDLATGDDPEQAFQLDYGWTGKGKNFLIFSRSGKPIWQRYGADALVSRHIGAIQAIISFYESAGDCLRAFTAGGARFVILAQKPIHLVAISRLGESELQLRNQLESLYLQILSTLTLPNLEQFFSVRPSADLRKPLQGTEGLLSALADGSTRGSFSTLLSSLECLRLRNRYRQSINDVLLRNRCSELLYGLIVAGKRLIAVVRPKTHSLHPSDIQLILNMVFESDNIQAGGGENWIPICLPNFNPSGFLYMCVSYVHLLSSIENKDGSAPVSTSVSVQELIMDDKEYQNTPKEQRVAIVLLSSKKDAFFEMQAYRNMLLSSLFSKSLLQVIYQAVQRGRIRMEDIVAKSPVRHFLYKSKSNLQFFAPSCSPYFEGLIRMRMLCCTYESLQRSMHAKGSHLDLHFTRHRGSTCLAWSTDVFELYCVASPEASRGDLTRTISKIMQWIRREEERLFIFGGAVF